MGNAFFFHLEIPLAIKMIKNEYSCSLDSMKIFSDAEECEEKVLK
jgi:hypothetical protein